MLFRECSYRVGQSLVVVIAFVTIMVMFFQTLWSSSDVLILRSTAASPQNLVHNVNSETWSDAFVYRSLLF